MALPSANAVVHPAEYHDNIPLNDVGPSSTSTSPSNHRQQTASPQPTSFVSSLFTTVSMQFSKSGQVLSEYVTRLGSKIDAEPSRRVRVASKILRWWIALGSSIFLVYLVISILSWKEAQMANILTQARNFKDDLELYRTHSREVYELLNQAYTDCRDDKEIFNVTSTSCAKIIAAGRPEVPEELLSGNSSMLYAKRPLMPLVRKCECPINVRTDENALNPFDLMAPNESDTALHYNVSLRMFGVRLLYSSSTSAGYLQAFSLFLMATSAVAFASYLVWRPVLNQVINTVSAALWYSPAWCFIALIAFNSNMTILMLLGVGIVARHMEIRPLSPRHRLGLSEDEHAILATARSQESGGMRRRNISRVAEGQLAEDQLPEDQFAEDQLAEDEARDQSPLRLERSARLYRWITETCR